MTQRRGAGNIFETASARAAKPSACSTPLPADRWRVFSSRPMKAIALAEWTLAAVLGAFLIWQLGASRTDRRDIAETAPRPVSRFARIDSVPPLRARRPPVTAPDADRDYGMHVTFNQLKGAWFYSLVALSAGRRPYAPGPGVALSLSLAEEMGINAEQLMILNRHAALTVEKLKAHEKTIAHLETGPDGEFWHIPAYPEKAAEILAEFRRRALADAGPRAAGAVDILLASPWLDAAGTWISVSAVQGAGGVTGVQIGYAGTHDTGYKEVSGTYESDAGIFAISRYGHLMNFASIERKK